MGFSSGLPLALTVATLSFWLAEIGVSLTAIGLFSLVAHLLQPQIPVVAADRPAADPAGDRAARAAARLGLGDPVPLALAILALGLTDPRVRSRAMTALAAVVVAFLSASQDIVIDAYRIELLRPEEQGAGAAATQWGYRFGMLASGRGRALRRELWRLGLRLMRDGGADAGRHGDGMADPGAGRDPPARAAARRNRRRAPAAWLGRAVVAPFVDLHPPHRGRPAGADPAVHVLYKFGDALAGTMSNPLYVSLGFTKVEVATIAKIYGVIATLAGVALGGVVVAAHRGVRARCSSAACCRCCRT